MLDVEDFDAVFQGVTYSAGILHKIQEYQHALGGKTFFERLLDLLNIKGKKIYPPTSNQALHDLHNRIISSTTTLHNKHCLLYYLLKDLSPLQHASTELASGFAHSVHLSPRFWTFIDGLWALDHLEFRTAVENLTHPSIIPTFPDEILYTLLKRDRLGAVGVEADSADDILALAYYNCVKPPMDDTNVRDAFAQYLSGRNVTEAYYWIQSRPEHEHPHLLEILTEETLDQNAWARKPGTNPYPRDDRALEFVGLPFTPEEDKLIEKFLTEGRGRTFQGAQDSVLMRRIAMGRLGDVVGETGVRGTQIGGVNWMILKDGVKKGLGERRDGEGFRV